jgi:hypothetical protein
MKKITIASPDKISIKSFISYIKFTVGSQYQVIELHHLMTPESIEMAIESLNPDKEYLISYYSNKKTQKENIPAKITEISDFLVWMDLYSNEWVILKDPTEKGKSYKIRWDMNMKKMLENE